MVEDSKLSKRLMILLGLVVKTILSSELALQAFLARFL